MHFGIGFRPIGCSLLALLMVACSCPPAADGGPGATDDSGVDAGPDAGEAGGDAGPTFGSGYPQLPYLGAPLLWPLRLVTLTPVNQELRPEIERFTDQVFTSPWWSTVSTAYGLDAGAFSTVHLAGKFMDAGVDPYFVPVEFAEIEAYCLEGLIDAGIPLDGHTLGVIVLPDQFYLASGNPAYHWTINGNDSCAAVNSVPGRFFLMTFEMTHEIAEAVTDPSDGTGYAFDGTFVLPPQFSPWAPPGSVTEACDLCSPESFLGTFEDAGVQYATVWSNADAAAGGDPCIPLRPDPYYSVRSEGDWFALRPGQTMSVPLKGWSTAPVANWFLSIGGVVTSQHLAGLSLAASLASPLGTGAPGPDAGQFPLVNAGMSATLSLTMDPSAAPADYDVVTIWSFNHDPDDPAFPINTDLAHEWKVGFYVPTSE